MTIHVHSLRTVQGYLDRGYWVLPYTPFRSNADCLSPGLFEVLTDAEDPEGHFRPRLGAIHQTDGTGGFRIGDRLHVSSNATIQHWEGLQEETRPHPFADHAGDVVTVFDFHENGALTVRVRFQTERGPVDAILPGDWLRKTTADDQKQ